MLTPAETREKLELLVSHLVRFEQLLDDALLEDVLPSVYQRYQDHYGVIHYAVYAKRCTNSALMTILNSCKKRCSVKAHFPEVKMAPQQAHLEFIRGNCELLPLDELEGRIAVEGHYRTHRAYCVVPGKCGRGQYCVISKH